MTPVMRVEVQEVRSNGIIVALPDQQRRGLIRWRELSWDRTLGATPPVPQIGEQLTAVLLHDRAGAALAELSVRRSHDPWDVIVQQYRVGQVVSGEVVNIRNFGVFVQLTPGVDAIIWPRDLPLRTGEPNATILAVGDWVQGVITQIDASLRKIELSLTDWLAQLSAASPLERYDFQVASLLPAVNTANAAQAVVDEPTPTIAGNTNMRYYPPLSPPEKVLIVDDNPADAQTIQQLLTETFHFAFDYVYSGQAALTRLQEDETYELAIVDLWLQHEHGEQVAHALLALKPTLTILFATSDPTAKPTIDIEGQRFPCVYKKPTEIADGINQLLDGYWGPTEHKPASTASGNNRFVQQLGMTAFDRRPTAEILQQLLQKLQGATGVSHVLLLEVDTVSKAVQIQSVFPPLAEPLLTRSLDGLYYSPVRTVVEGQEEFYRPHVQQNRSAQFKNFFPLLAFHACYGLPLTIPDHTTRHALFLLDEGRREFDERLFTQAQLTAYLLQVALERAMLLEFMRRFELRYTHGILLNTLVHELLAKLDGLGGQSQRLVNLAAQPGEIQPKLKTITQEIVHARQDMTELVHAYSRMAQGRLEAVDVHLLTQKVLRQLANRANEGRVLLRLVRPDPLPLAYTIASRLEQVITNLVLNSIQQIERQAQELKRLAQETGAPSPLLQTGVVWVKLQLNPHNPTYPIQVLVIDTGPGIHRHQQEDIFLLDTSNRYRGHGLGLFISRNLIETMGGRLRLLRSILFVGSVFCVELPSAAGAI